jgi:CHAT domain-containing protein
MDTTIYSIVLTPQNVMFNTNTTDPTIINAYKSKCADLSFQINQPKQFIDLSFNVYQQILQANLVNEKSNNIIILPDGILNGLSFDALITKKSSITNYKVQAFLVKKYQTQYGFSYGSLLQKSNTKTINNNVMMAFAPATNSALPNKEVLHFSLDEANAIKMIFPKTLLFLDSQATKQNFINNYRNCSIIHLSTHSEADPFLGNSSIDFYDTKMVANQFYTHDDFKAKLVFLSACETIVGKQTASEGVLSLARSIYYAGAQNVISSQWIINDESTKILVSHFYKNLDGNQYATALQNAKQIYIKQCSPENAAPFYWASLCNIGVNLQIKKSTNYWWLIIGLISVVLIYVSKTKNRKNKQKFRNFQ